MTKLIRNNQKGFTLIELMIVVAIIGILAAIAIPNFMKYQLKSKTAEAKVNLGAIATSQESYRAERDVYRVCAEYPAGRSNLRQTWNPAAAGGFTSIGFSPSGKVYYDYEVTSTDTSANFTGIAYGDLDNDSSDGQFELDNTRTFTDVNPGLY